MECLSSRREREAPGGGGARKSKIHPGAIPGNLFRNDFLAVRRSWRGNGVACFWATSLEKIFGGRSRSSRSAQEDGCSSLPCRDVLSFRSEARETLGNETARVHHASRRRGCGLAARGARTNQTC